MIPKMEMNRELFDGENTRQIPYAACECFGLKHVRTHSHRFVLIILNEFNKKFNEFNVTNFQ